eukprot:TRINITY_DN1671_c0_g1_i1.p1 TRINITY_DN1671_c0_g1~~TRINITY_DN1671_c0_g1_i1.p1  ORF type:complete len:357 (-),score=48.13 TRINITY_DN1671_c0_g1_i1:50-1120(-)
MACSQLANSPIFSNNTQLLEFLMNHHLCCTKYTGNNSMANILNIITNKLPEKPTEHIVDLLNAIIYNEILNGNVDDYLLQYAQIGLIIKILKIENRSNTMILRDHSDVITYASSLLNLLNYQNIPVYFKIQALKFCQCLKEHMRAVSQLDVVLNLLSKALLKITKTEEKLFPELVYSFLMYFNILVHHNSFNSEEHQIHTSYFKNTTAEDIIDILLDQDDVLINGLLLLLKIYTKLLNASIVQLEGYNPTEVFYEFLKSVSFDESILLDFLINNETNFLGYILKYANYVLSAPSELACEKMICVRGTIGRLNQNLIRLTNKNLLPYNLDPLIRKFGLILINGTDTKNSSSEFHNFF